MLAKLICTYCKIISKISYYMDTWIFHISIILPKKWEVIIIITMEKLTLIYIINDQEGFLTFYWWYCNLAHSHFWGPLTDFISIEIHNTQPVCSSAISVLNVSFNKIHICKETCKIIVFNCLNLDSNYQSLVKELKLW